MLVYIYDRIMSKFILILKFFVFCFILSIWLVANASGSISDIKENIRILQEKQSEILKSDVDLYSIWDIENFIRDDLNSKENVELTNIIQNYNYQSNKLRNSKSNFNNLLDLKRETYKKIWNYVDKSNLWEYLEYIKINIEIAYESNEIENEILKNEELLNNKLTDIKEQISKNKEKIQTNLNDVINSKVDEKINQIKNNENFKKLDLEKKRYIIEKIISYTKNKRTDRNKVSTGTSIKEIDVYYIIIEKLQSFYWELI